MSVTVKDDIVAEKLTRQELKWKIISFLPFYVHAKMAGRKRKDIK